MFASFVSLALMTFAGLSQAQYEGGAIQREAAVYEEFYNQSFNLNRVFELSQYPGFRLSKISINTQRIGYGIASVDLFINGYGRGTQNIGDFGLIEFDMGYQNIDLGFGVPDITLRFRGRAYVRTVSIVLTPDNYGFPGDNPGNGYEGYTETRPMNVSIYNNGRIDLGRFFNLQNFRSVAMVRLQVSGEGTLQLLTNGFQSGFARVSGGLRYINFEIPYNQQNTVSSLVIVGRGNMQIRQATLTSGY